MEVYFEVFNNCTCRCKWFNVSAWVCEKVMPFSKAGYCAKDWTKEKCLEWLSEIGVSTSRSKKDLVTRIECFQQFPNLLQKLRKRAKRNYKFPTSLPHKDILAKYLFVEIRFFPKI